MRVNLRVVSPLETPLLANSTISVRKPTEKHSCTHGGRWCNLAARLCWSGGCAALSVAVVDVSHRRSRTDRAEHRNRCAGDGRAKDEGGARPWSPARLDTLLVVCLSTYLIG